MYLRCFNYVQIVQQPSGKYPLRTKTIQMDVLNSYEVVSAWDAQTDTAKVVIPKNIIAKDADDKPISLQNLNISIGGGDNPLFLRGDRLSIQAGYRYMDAKGVEQQYVKLLFNGYITKVHSKLTITLECEDNMYLLKQVPMPNQVMTNIAMQDILQQALAGTVAEQNGITVNTASASRFVAGVGTLKTSNESVAQFLANMKQDINMPSYFKDNELRIWYPTYYPQDVQNMNTPYNNNTAPFKFIFQQNIISDNLQYARTDDMTVSAIATATYRPAPGKDGPMTKDQQPITRLQSHQVFVYSDPTTQTLKTQVIDDSHPLPTDITGQRYEYNFTDCQTVEELTNRAVSELQKVYYTGFRGSFTTFGMPYIPYGDNIVLSDPILPDRNGTYKVKAVTYTGGIGIGIRQEIFLDYKIAS